MLRAHVVPGDERRRLRAGLRAADAVADLGRLNPEGEDRFRIDA
jgi:hypothetical protein